MELISLNSAWVSTLLLQSQQHSFWNISPGLLMCKHQVPKPRFKNLPGLETREQTEIPSKTGPGRATHREAGFLKHAAPGNTCPGPRLRRRP